MIERVVVSRPSPNVLIVRHTKVWKSALFVLFMLGFALLAYLSPDNELARIPWVAPAIVFLVALPWLVRPLRTFLRGRVYEFDGTTRTVRHNGKNVASFDNIEKVQVAECHTEGEPGYRLSLVVKSRGAETILLDTSDKKHLRETANDIAEFLETEVYEYPAKK